LFGSDAIGGVVSVITRQGGPLRADVTAEGGSLGTVQAAAGAAGTAGTFTWGTTIERAQSDGFRGLSAGGEPVRNDDYLRHTFTATAGWRGRAGTDVRGSVRAGSQERGFPGPFGSDPGQTYSGVDLVSRGSTDSRALALTATQDLGVRTRLRGQVTRTDIDGSFVSGFGPSESSTDRWTLRAQADSSIHDRLSTSAGVEWLDERGGSSFITDALGNERPVTRDNFGAFAEARYEPAPRLLIAAGLRVERIHRDPLDGNSFSRPAFDADTETSVNPKIAASVWLVPAGATSPTWTRLHGSAGTGIRAPDAFEIAFTDNPSLAAERSRSFDIGIEQAFYAGRLIADATVFANRYDDLIVAVGRAQDASRYRTDNIANARSSGLELSIAGQSHGFDARLAYTWLDTEILAVDGQSGLAPTPFAPGDPLFRRPRHQATIDVTYVRERWSAYAAVRARGEVLDIDPSFGTFGGLYTAPGFTVANIGGRVRLLANVHVFARVDNLFDRHYEEALGFPALGRTAMVGLSLAASR
jgi:outer membrane receptor protein involved in Fe transport